MSGFAPVTQALLARKGSAEPSQQAKQPFVWQPQPAPGKLFSHAPSPRPHRITVALSTAEYQALGIAAVKKDVTRHSILRDALDLHLSRLALEYDACSCIGSGQGCDQPCSLGAVK